MFRKLSSLALIAALAATHTFALNIKVIDDGEASGHHMVSAAKNQLTVLGHTLTTGGTLADYSSFDQVWDLRYSANLGAADVLAMGAYLASGGRMYLTGENSAFDGSRNNSLLTFINSVGGGLLTLQNAATFAPQTFTPEGLALNAPNVLPLLNYGAARTVGAADTGNGFLVTESDYDDGSVVAWDFGDISANSRMIVGFDIEIFANGQDWTENMATYLGASSPAPGAPSVPDASTTGLLLGASLLGLVTLRRFKRS